MTDSTLFGKWISHPPPGEEVVITGISGRFPESENVHKFKENLFNKRDMVSDDDRRWKVNDPEIPQRSGKISHIDKLDAGYFGLHYVEANNMDPMMRKLLEVTIEAILDAGFSLSELEGSKTGVFIAASIAQMEIEPQSFAITSYSRSFLAHRISYFLKLKGPSCVVDSACSSSLNAVDFAFRMMREGQCDQAIVGSGNLLLHPGLTRQFFRLGVLSSDGVCKVFDEAADGYVKSEAVSCIFLQKAKDSRRIYAQVIHTKVMTDGFKPVGISFPSTQVQEQLISEILEESCISPNQISYTEAHSTGTAVGDPLEVEAIDNAIARKRTRPLLIGSVKSNMGHGEHSSGLSSLIKVLIAIESGYISPNIHLKNVKKGIVGFEEGRMIPVTEVIKLDRNALIGINNFGFGGNDCHLLIRGFKLTESKELSGEDKESKELPGEDKRLVCVSGRTEEAVKSLLNDVNHHFDKEYVGLLHEIFKRDLKGHFYRGHAIVSKTGVVKTDFKLFRKQKPFYVVFGQFEKGFRNLSKDLFEIPQFTSSISKINKLLQQIELYDTRIENHETFCSFAVQIGIVDLLKLLELSPFVVCNDYVGNLVSSYYYEKMSLKEAVYNVLDNFEEIRIANEDNLHMQKKILRKYIKTYIKFCIKDTDSFILNISDKTLNCRHSLQFDENTNLTFLEVLGSLYKNGYCPQIQKLYPPVEFPVTRGTPMISPHIRWNHKKSWYTYKFGMSSGNIIAQKEYSLSTDTYEEQKYMAGHVIDGRNLVPATAYLYYVWQTFLQSYNSAEKEQLPIVFENCKFVRALSLPKNGFVKILVSIQNSGNFEITEKNSVVASGNIFTTKRIEKFFTDLPVLSSNQTEILDQDEIYRELSLRGYNYSGLFKGVVKCSVDKTIGLVRWEDNWTTFLDKMLQLKLLQMNTRLLNVPVSIKRMAIEPSQHQLFTQNQKDGCHVYCYQESNTIKSGGVEIQGFQVTAIGGRQLRAEPLKEKYIFIPNNLETNLDQSARIITQIIVENSSVSNFKAVEIIDKFTLPQSELLLPMVSKALDDHPLVTSDLSISSQTPVTESTIPVENFTISSCENLLLVVASKIFQRPCLLKQALDSLSFDGFLLTREDLDFFPKIDTVEILCEHVTSFEKCVLLRKRHKIGRTEFVEIRPDGFEWLTQLQKMIKKAEDVVVYGYNKEANGVMGLVNCLRREPQRRKIRCFFLMEPLRKFDPQSKIFKDQLNKQMAFNVLKEGKWGTYRHLPLERKQEVESEHVFVNNVVRGDLSSLKWVQGPLTSKNLVAFPYFCGINFKDIMIASGRVGINSVTNDRLEQECLLGFEFCGLDNRGRKIMAIGGSRSTANLVLLEKHLLWEIPTHWTLEDASTVPLVYSTVLYALLKVTTLKAGMSILIHSAAGGIGLAALNVCLFHKCEIYLTVGTQEKRKYLKKHYPQIPDNHIGFSRDTSFEGMIKTGTKGRGVDLVLNSLTEDKLRASMRCLAPGGCFLELGRVDMRNDSPLEMFFLERSISYHGVMLDRIFSDSEELKTWLVDKLYEGIRLGYVRPLPRRVYEMNEVLEAYKYMTTGQHIGKIVVKIREGIEMKLYKAYPRFSCNFQKSYIIIGGLGGFGLELTDWLYLKGAKKILLVSRSGIQTGYQTQRIRAWNSADVSIQISTENITTIQGCINLINQAKSLGAVDAIFNLAAVLKDALFENQSEETFRIASSPKARATMNLDQVTRELCPDLRYFVVFSSISCGRGIAGQTNYGMANSVMERICERRKTDGLPGLAIQWGAIGDVGLVAKMQKEKELLIGGTVQQKVPSCLAVLDTFLNQNNPVVSSIVVAKKIDKTNFVGTPVEAVASVLGIRDIKIVSPHSNFAELGMDSMMATEVLQILEKKFNIYLTSKEARNLTFSKLLELQENVKLEEALIGKFVKNREVILRMLPGESTILKIKMPSQTKKNLTTVFVLGGLEGVLKILEAVTKNLETDVFGIEYDNTNSANTVEEIAKMTLTLIDRTVSKEGSFFIIGYSFGATVATELTVLLESRGYRGKLVAIEGSPSYGTLTAREHLPFTNENELQTAFILRVFTFLIPLQHLEILKEKFMACKTLDERIDLAISLVPKDIKAIQELSKRAMIGYYQRCKALLHYKFVHEKIKSDVYLFKAKMPMLSDFAEDYEFSEVCRKVKVILLDGDHSTILDRSQLGTDINKLLSDNCLANK